jgi:hypothetical protein
MVGDDESGCIHLFCCLLAMLQLLEVFEKGETLIVWGAN